MILWPALAVITPAALLSGLSRFAPERLVRLAFVPIRRAATLALPAQVAEIAAPLLPGGGTYREAAARDVALVALPGARRVEREGHVIRFLPELRCIAAHPAQSSHRLLRVDVASDPSGWLLRGRRFPSEEILGGLLAIALAGTSLAGWRWPPWMLVAVVVGQAFAILHARRAATTSFDAVLAELQARVALANGETPPPPSEPPLTTARFTSPDEWTCPCGEVNARKRGMCRRCWSQRPKG